MVAEGDGAVADAAAFVADVTPPGRNRAPDRMAPWHSIVGVAAAAAGCYETAQGQEVVPAVGFVALRF